MVYNVEEMLKALEKFKINALLRLQSVELKLDNLDEDKDEVKKDLKNLEKTLISDIDKLNERFESFREDMPHKTTNKIIFTVFGATLSFLFAMILLIFEGKLI